MNAFLERILVTLDAASESRDAIEIAARLAAWIQVPLHGVFVEDEDLLALANLPFARQVTLGAGAGPLTRQRIEEELHVAAERAKRALAATADRHGLAWSFEIVRGSPQSAPFLASPHDLIVAGALTRAVGGQFRLACRWWSWIGAAPGLFLLTRRGWEPSGAVLIMLRDRCPRSRRLLDAAARIAGARNARLTVICETESTGERDLDAWVSNQLTARSIPFQIERLPAEEVALQHLMLELDCGLLAVGPYWFEERPDWIRHLVERLACDLLVVP